MGKLIRILFWTSVVVGVVVGGLKATYLNWWRVPSDDPLFGASLAPSLYPGDLVLLWRGTLKFGDLARCADPEAPGRYIVGRIYGEPGDQIVFSGPEVSVNDRRAIQEHSCSPGTFTIADPSTGADVTLHCGVTSINSNKHLRATTVNPSMYNITRKATVADGQFYLVSDNRVYPLDSRDFGGVPKESCKEFVFFRIKGVKGWGDVNTRLTFIQ